MLVSAAGAAVSGAVSGAVRQLCCVFSTFSTEVAALLLAFGCAAVCTVAPVKLVLLAAPRLVSLCAVGVSHLSAIVILSSPMSSLSLLLLSAVRPLFE